MPAAFVPPSLCPPPPQIKSFIPGCALMSMDNYNDGSKVIDGNFDGACTGGGGAVGRAGRRWMQPCMAWREAGTGMRRQWQEAAVQAAAGVPVPGATVPGRRGLHAARPDAPRCHPLITTAVHADPRITDYDTLLANIADLKAGRCTQVRWAGSGEGRGWLCRRAEAAAGSPAGECQCLASHAGEHDARQQVPPSRPDLPPSVQVPIYDFKTSSRVGYRTVEVPESRVVRRGGMLCVWGWVGVCGGGGGWGVGGGGGGGGPACALRSTPLRMHRAVQLSE